MSSATTGDRVLAERIRLLYRQLPVTQASGFTVAVALCAVLWPHSSPQVLAAWFAAHFAMQIWRFVLYMRFRAAGYLDQAPPRAERWAFQYTCAYAAVGAVWGFVPIGLFPEGAPAIQAFLFIAMTGLVAGSLALHALHLPALYAFLFVILLPLAGRYLYRGELEDLLLAALNFIFVAIVISHARSVARTINDAIDFRFRNEDLAHQLRAEKIAAENAVRSKTVFFAAANHDLRQPLQALGLFAAALRERSKEPESLALVASIKECVDALRSLYEGLLDVSRLDAGVVQPAPRDFAAQSLLDHVANTFGPIVRERGQRLRVRPSRATLYADPELLRQIVDNLVQNAIRHSAAGTILVAVRRRAGRFAIEVRDGGHGIAAEDHERIFQEFEQLGNPERDRAKGLGLGLAICRRLALLLDTQVAVVSAAGRGATFSILVSAGRPAQIAADLPEPADPERYGEIFPGRRVLVIDDEALAREAIAVLLRTWGCEAHTAAGADEALALAAFQAQPPDAAVLDLRLRGGENGIAALARIERRYRVPVPAVIVTGDTSPERIAEAAASGRTLLHKPVSAAQLRSTLAHLFAASAT